MRAVSIGIVASFIAGTAYAQAISGPTGFEITNRLTFKHEQNQALFGNNPVTILCVSRGEYRPTVLVGAAEAFAINGHARSLLVGESIFIDGKKVGISDPYRVKDARSEFIGMMPGQISKACAEK